MKRAISTLLAILPIGIVLLSTVTNAQTMGAVQPSVNSQAVAKQLSPFDLAYLAYQGDLKSQGIPSYGALIDAISSGKVTAQTVVQAAVRVNDLSTQTLTDRGYLFALQSQLDGFLVDD